MRASERGGGRRPGAQESRTVEGIRKRRAPRDDPVERGASGVKRTSEMMTRTRVRERQREAWTRWTRDSRSYNSGSRRLIAGD